ncbi:unnamed protein product [marine sediment metagenome]|uniref:Uncharacterized protein n=1 Tax=marine sediment metagenome TaxID=412755 RepID=X0ST87_9ZZZZ
MRVLNLKAVIQDTVKNRLVNIDKKDEVARMRVIKQTHRVAPVLLEIQEFLQSQKER